MCCATGDCDNSSDVTDDDIDDNDEDNEDDDEGWITPSNVEAMKQATVALTASEPTELPVACVTTDYAMQVPFAHVLCCILINLCYPFQIIDQLN